MEKSSEELDKEISSLKAKVSRKQTLTGFAIILSSPFIVAAICKYIRFAWNLIM